MSWDPENPDDMPQAKPPESVFDIPELAGVEFKFWKCPECPSKAVAWVGCLAICQHCGRTNRGDQAMEGVSVEVEGSRGYIVVDSSDEFRLAVFMSFEVNYRNVCLALKPILAEAGRDPVEWVDLPPEMTVDQRSVFLEGVRCRLVDAIAGLCAPGERHSHSSMLVNQWVGAGMNCREVDYASDIEKLKQISKG